MISVISRWGVAIGSIGVFLATAGAPHVAVAQGDDHFATRIAPLLSQRCLECHRGENPKGNLDLSTRATALAGGRGGPAIAPGKAADSRLWKYVENDRMPKGRAPLSAAEKEQLRQWLDAGAAWPADAALAWSPDAARRQAGSPWARRLTVEEYIATVWAAVGVDLEEDARRLLPRDVRADGFSNTAYNLSIDLAHVEAYARLAEIAARRMDLAAFAAEHAPGGRLSSANLAETIALAGQWLLRGPLAETELAAFRRVAAVVAEEGGDADESLRYVVEAMLQSPRFLFRIENQRGDGEARPVDGYELASRLSYTVWGAPPDKELLRAAAAGELADRSRVAAQVRRMLADPRAVDRSVQFIDEWLHLDRLNTLRPSRQHFPHWNAALAADMRNETRAYFEELVWRENRPLAELLNAQFTFATPRLAAHYGLDRSLAAPAGDGRLPKSGPERVSAGLQALYTFDDAAGSTVADVSMAGAPLPLVIDNPGAVAWGDGKLTIHNRVRIATATPPTRLIDALQQSNALTLEAWVATADAKQTGPARIVTLSSGASLRNFTLGQDGDKFDVRLRATRTDANGMPSVASRGGAAKTGQLTHVAYTRNSAGQAIVYVDGEQQGAGPRGGDLSNWDANFLLMLGDESTGDRPWRGELHLVAMYDRALSGEEVERNFAAGPQQDTQLRRYDLSTTPGRGGLLTQASVLTIGGDEASMVTRGLFVLRELLYSRVEDPPPCVDTTPVATGPGLSQRAAALQRINNPACSACHERFESLAFGLERFDGVGAYHEVDEHGNALRWDGEVRFPERLDRPVAYQSAAELMDLLARSERVQMALTRKVVQFAIGRPLLEADTAEVEKIHAAAQSEGGTYAALLTAITLSDFVLITRTENDR